MNEAILSAPAALLIYVALVGILYLAGRRHDALVGHG